MGMESGIAFSAAGMVATGIHGTEPGTAVSPGAGGLPRRVMALVDLAARGEQVIRHAAACCRGGEAALLAVHVADGRSLVDSDGPCGYFLAAERGARRMPDAARRLDQLLARNQAAWAESAVLTAGSSADLRALIERWRPDLVVTDRRSADHALTAPALRRGACRVELADTHGAPAGPISELTKGDKPMSDSKSGEAGDDRRTLIAKTAFYGLATLLLYLLLFANEDAVLRLSALGRWYFVLPIVIAFVFSFFHGAFTGMFWDALGVKASGRKG